MTSVNKSTVNTTTTTRRTGCEPTAPSSTPTAAPTAAPARQPDPTERAQLARLTGTESTTSRATAPTVQGDPALKGELERARAAGGARPTWTPPAHVRSYQMGPGLADVKNGGVLARGQMGQGVVDAQRKLNAALKGTGCNSLAVDGLYGPKTEANVRAYQESRGLPVTGQLDKTTLAALDSNKASIPGWTPSARDTDVGSPGVSGQAPTGVVSTVTANMSEAEKFDHYKAMIEKSGGTFNPNGPNIVGVRNPTDADVNGGGGRYDDTFAVVWKDKAGQPHVREFRGNTEPAAHYRGRMGDDVNGDGRLDQGRLRTGHYTYAVSSYHGASALRMRGDSVVDRDANQDGVFGNDGGAASRGGASMLFHRGGSNTTGSAGCQTLPPAEFDKFMGALREAGLGRSTQNVGYTLVDN